MKKMLSVLLLIVLLCQALPINALAAIGKVLTGEELAAAYILTGLSSVTGGVQRNAVYHKGMKPNATWNAMQVSDWLDEVMGDDLLNVEDILSRASVAMARLKESNSGAYRRLSGGDPQYATVFDNLQQMYIDAEALREEMRYYRDSLQEQANLIAELGHQLETDGGGMFSSERVRLSAKIETASAELDTARKEVAQKADGWTESIQSWSTRLGLLTEGAHDENPGWFDELYSYDQSPVENAASVVAVNASNSRLGKLSAGASVLASNDQKAKAFVLSENEIAIELVTGKDGKTPVEGVEVTIRDLRDAYAQDIVRTTDSKGRIILLSNLFKADDHKKIHVKLDVDGEAKGYRSFGVEECRIKQGQSYKGTMVPLDDKPYIYSASFHGYDILSQDFEMLYSDLNDYDFEIKVQTRNPGGKGLTPAPKFCYYKKDESELLGWKHISSWKYKKHLVDAKSHEGNTYVFKGPWKQNLTPWVGKDYKPFFTFDGDDDKDARITTRLISVKGAVDAPIEEGTLAFVNVMGKGLSFKFSIPCPTGKNLDFKIDVPIKAYLPKVTIDQGGYVTIIVGSPMVVDKNSDSKLNWKNEELESLKDNEKAREQEGFFANQKAQYGLAFDYYTSNRVSFLMESKLELGVFVLASGRWALDNQVEDVKQLVISFRGGFGMLLKYSFSWTVRWLLLAFPMYLTLMLSITAGFQFNSELSFSWINGGFQNWSFKPVRDITITFGISFTAILGAGIKGFIEGWLRFVAGINLRLHLAILSQERSTISGSYFVNATVGLTLFWLTTSVTFWKAADKLFDPVPLGNALPPLQQYALANAEPEEQQAATQEPMSYPGLVPTATKVQLGGTDSRARTKVAVIGGQTYLFHLAKVKGKDKKERVRLCWVNASDNSKKGSTQTAIDAWSSGLNGRQDYAFDVVAADGYVFAAVACAAEFDENGNPKPNANLSDKVKCNQIFYLLMLRPDGKKNLTATLNKGYYLTGIPEATVLDPEPKKELVDHVLVTGEPVGIYIKDDGTPNKRTERYYYDSIDNPEITWARAFSEKGTCLGIEFFGTFGRVTYSDDADPCGMTSFELIRGKEGVRCFTDEFVESGMGEDYVRTEVRGTMRCSNTEPKVHDRSVDPRYSPSFLALGRPKDGGDGDRSIELFDFEMNGVLYGGRKTVVLEKGAIEHFEMAQTAVDGDGTNVRRMVFYTEKETSDDGAEQSRLHGLYLEPLQRDGRNLTFDVTRYDYDLTVPAEGRFSLAYIGDVPYLYWVTSAPRENENDSDMFRIMASAYDMSTNTMTAPAVYAEFSLPSYKFERKLKDNLGKTKTYSKSLDLVPQYLLLTGTGTAYLSAVADTTPIREWIDEYGAPEALMPAVPPVELYSFPVQMKPLLELQELFFEDTTVCAGEFEDVTIGLMNAGNMGVANFELEMYTLENGKTKVWETIHADCLYPERSTLTMAGSKEAEELPGNTPVIYRDSDYDYTPRQRDWVLDQVKRQFHVMVGSRVEVTGVDEVDSNTQFVQTDMLMPGALASFTGTLKIPEGWSGEKTMYMRVSKISTYSNWARAMANAAGARANGIAANAALPEELTWELDESKGEMVLQTSGLASNGTAANAVRSGIIANAVEASEDIALGVANQDVEVDHRVYGDSEGNDMLDIIISNYTATQDNFKLTCAVYLDQEEEPYYVNLPYYASALADRRTHTITMPVRALLPENDAHYQARVVISAIDRQESAFANNEFTIHLDGGGALHIVEQPQDQTVQEGEDVSFEVEVAGGTKPYSYQWQVWDEKHQKWVDLPGFTGPTLSRKNIEKKWDGCRFRCVITDANGDQVITNEVTLTVRDKVPTGDSSNLPLYLAVAMVALILLWIVRKRMRRAQ